MTTNTIVRMRIILAFLAGALLFGQSAIVNWSAMAAVRNHDGSTSDIRPLFHAVDGILFLAAVIIFTFSFVRIKRDGGELCYDPANPYWRFMKWSYGDGWGERVSLCKSYWLTVWLLFFPSAGVTFITLFVIFVLPSAWRDFVKDPLRALLCGAELVGLVAAATVLLTAAAWLTTKAKWLNYVWITLALCLAIGVAIVMPINAIASTRQISVTAASGVYSEYIAGIIGAGALLAGLIWGAFKFIPWLRNTWLGQLLGALKDRICPTLVACPCGEEGVCQEPKS